MANLDLATLRVVIEADSAAVVKETQKIVDAVDGVSRDAQEAARASESAVKGAAEESGKSVKNAAKQASTSIQGAQKKMSEIGKNMTAKVTLPIVAAFAACVKGSSDLTETVSKTDEVFKQQSDRVMDWAGGSIEAMGLATGTALDMASTYGDMGTSMGQTTAQAYEMSTSLVQLAADMASFKNISIDRAQTALTAIYTGETESLKALGIVMTQANLQAYALSQGITTQVSAMSQAEQVQLRYQYVMAQTANAQGDFVRTGGSLANQSRKLVESIKQLGTSFGALLAPAVTSVVTTIQSAVQWLTESDSGVKGVILAIAGVVAAIGPLLLVGAKVIKLITAIKVALTALSLNPIVLAIMAVVAAMGLLAAGISSLKSKSVDIETNHYENAYVSVKQDSENGIDGVLSEIENAIQRAENADRLLAEIETAQDDTENVSKVLTAIDEALKAQEYVCEVQGKKKEDDETWTYLTDLRNGLEGGTISVSGIDKDGTLESLRSKVAGINGNLAMIKLWELSVIQPKIEVQSEDADTRTKALYDRMAEIAGIDTSIEYAFTTKGIESLDSVNASLATVITSSEAWNKNIGEIEESLQGAIDKQKEYIRQAAVLQVENAFEAHEQGLITDEQLESTLTAISEQTQTLTENTDIYLEAYDKLQRALTDGDKSNDTEAMTEFRSETKGLRREEAEQAPQEKIANYQGQRTDATQAGLDETAQTGAIAKQNAAYKEAADTINNELVAAYDAYVNELSLVDQAEQRGLDSVSDEITAKSEASDALSTYSAFLRENSDNAQEALAQLKAFDEGAYNTVLETLGGEEGALEANAQGTLNAAAQMQAELAALEASAEDKRQAVRDAADAARIAAEEGLVSQLSTINSGFTQEDLERMRQTELEKGNVEGAAHIERIQNLQGYCDTAAAAVEAGDAAVLAQSEMLIGELAGLAGTAQSAGEGIGKSLMSGMTNKIISATSAAAAAAALAVRTVALAAKAAGEIKSPSRLMAREVGAPLMQGLEQGFTGQVPAALKSIQAGMRNIVSGAARVVDHGAFTAPAVAMAGGAAAGIDYERLTGALADAVAERPAFFNVGSRRLAQATRDDAAREQAVRVDQVSMGYGRGW